RSFIQTSSSSCCSPYAFRVAAGSLRIGSSRRIRLTRPANRHSRRPRSRSTFPECSASETSVPRRPSVLDVPSLEVVLQVLFSAVEVPPRAGVSVGEVREGLEVLHSLRPNVLHLCHERLLPERVFPDRPARDEPGRPALARAPDEPPEDVEVGPRAQPESLHLLYAPAVEQGREPPVPFLLVSGLLERHEEPGPTREDEPIDRRRHAELRIQEVAARVGGEGLRDLELDRLHLGVRRGLRVLRMEHLLKAPPLVHRDHREAACVVRNLLEATQLADRNPHSWSPVVRKRGCHLDLCCERTFGALYGTGTAVCLIRNRCEGILAFGFIVPCDGGANLYLGKLL